jgi:hypothetical protein
MSVGEGGVVDSSDRVVVDLAAANRDRGAFGDDAGQFNPNRPIRSGQFPFGLTFGTGVHACLGRDLDAGAIAKGGVDPATHQYGLVTLLAAVLLEEGARPDPIVPPRPDLNTERQNWGYYAVRFGR